ncbi:restriction endonuclease subunit S [Flavobacterium sp. WC2416]|uniref:Restriction endonuclease subunit S n=1 Tax=Flavobacterium sp. WC2416 TaxID=3234141 RepID=A0AB39W9A3_9FLAO
MPNNWKTYKLSDFIDINPLVKLKSHESYSFVEMKDLDANNRTVSPSDFKPLKGGARFQNNDTLFARITPCLQNGKICRVKGLKENVGFGSTEFLVFRGEKGVSDTDFVYYLSREPFFRQFAENNMIGTSGRQRVAKQAFQNLELELPPLQEQQSIASILSAIDDKIENNLAINKTLEEMAMALYKHWFVDFGPFQDGEFVESELGMIPKDWEVLRLQDVSSLTAGGDKPKKYSNQKTENCSVPIYSNGITNEGLFGFTDISKIKEESITVSARGTIGYVCLRTQPYVPIVRLIAVVPNKKLISCKYLFFWLLNQNISGNGTTQQQLTVPDFKSTKVLIPQIKLINDFTEIVNPYYEKINSNKIENQTLTKLRDTLLPKLISGEVRLKEFQEQFATN